MNGDQWDAISRPRELALASAFVAMVGWELAEFLILEGPHGTHGGLSLALHLYNVLDNKHETFGTFAPDGRLPGDPVVRFLTPAPPITRTQRPPPATPTAGAHDGAAPRTR